MTYNHYGREASVGRACANPACGRLLPLGPWSWKLCPRCMASGKKVPPPEPPREPVSRLLAGFVALALSIIGWGLVFTLVFVLFGCAGRPKLSTDCWAGLPGVGLCLTVEQREEIGGKP